MSGLSATPGGPAELRAAPVTAPMRPGGVDAPVSVVIITRDRPAELLRTLGELAGLPDRPAVIVVDNGSASDPTPTVRRRFPAVTVLPLARNAGAYGRTIGAWWAATPLVAFSDDDSWWAPHALQRAAELFTAHPRLGLLAARVLVGADRRRDPTCAAMAVSRLGTAADLPGPSVRGFVACGAVVRRDAFLAAGGFRAAYGIGGEEALLAIDLARAGWGLAYVDEVVAHHHPSTVREPGGRQHAIVRNDLWTAWLRRPAGSALRRSAALLRAGWRDVATWRGAAAALAGLGGIRRARAPVPRWLEAELAALERA